MRRVALTVAILLSGACTSDPPVEPKACESACGVGFTCQEGSCVLDPNAAIEVELIAPVADAWLSDAEVSFECRVKAPQVKRVLVRVTGEGVESLEVALEKVAAQDSWSGTAGLVDGEFEASCLVEFGPPAATETRESEPIAFGVAVGLPVVSVDPIEGWFGATAVVRVTAKQVAGPLAESAQLSVDSPPLLVDGVPDGEGGWTFDVKVSSLTNKAVETQFPFVVSIKDRAGGEDTADGFINVDTIKPTAVIASQIDWIRAGGAAIVEVTADDGIGISAVRLSGDGKSYTGVLQGGKWMFSIDVGALVEGDFEGDIAYRVDVSDLAGNTETVDGTFHIDTVSPSIVSTPLSNWFSSGAAVVSATIVEGYGVEKASLVFDDSSVVVQGMHQVGSEWTFPVSIEELAGGPMEAAKAYEIVVEDLSGNVGKVQGVLRVDNVKPVVAIAFEATWLSASDTGSVAVQVVDGGVVQDATLVIRGRTHQAVREGAVWEFSIPASDILNGAEEGRVPYLVIVRDAAGNQASIESTLGLDSVAPKIEIKSLPEWVRRDSTMTVEAIVIDGASIDPTSVVVSMGGKNIAGAAQDNRSYLFQVPLDEVTPNEVEGPVTFTVSASDLAGNITSEDGAVKVDASPPEVTVTGDPDAAWRGPAPFNFTASVSSSGAPLLSATLSRTSGDLAIPLTTPSANLTYVVDPAAWQMSGTEGAVPWTLTVIDAAGHQVVKSGAFKIDRKAPIVEPNAPSAWFSSSLVEVNPTVTDGGSGPSLTYMEWEASGQSGTCSRVSGVWKCPVATLLASGATSDRFSFKIIAMDAVGNVATVESYLRIDKEGPSLSLSPDGKWYPRNASILVRANATDSGAGVDTSVAPKLKILSPVSSTQTGVWDGELALFTVSASSVVASGAESGAVSVQVEVQDKLGNVRTVSTNSQFFVDDKVPAISHGEVVYPYGRSNVALRDPYGSRSWVTFRANVTDSGSGLSEVGVRVNGSVYPFTNKGGDAYTFVLNAADFGIVGGWGELTASIVATDAVGNRREMALGFSYSRILWSRSVASDPLVGSPAFDGSYIYATISKSGSGGATGYNVLAVNPNDGSTGWSALVPGTPTTPPVVVGASNLVLATNDSGGTLHYLNRFPSGSTQEPALYLTGVGETSHLIAKTVNWRRNVLRVNDYADTAVFVGADSRLRAYRPITRQIYGTTVEQEAELQLPTADKFYPPVFVGADVYVGARGGRVSRARFDVVNGMFDAWDGVLAYDSSSPLISSGMGLGPLSVDAGRRIGFANNAGDGTGFVRFLSANLSTAWNSSSPHAGPPSAMVIGTSNEMRYTSYGAGYTVLPSGAEVLNPYGGRGIASSAGLTLGIGADGNERIYFGFGGETNVGEFGLDWKRLWYVELDAGVAVPIVLGCDGVAYVVTSAGTMYAIVTDSIGLAKGAWPRYQHDNRNSGDADFQTWNGNTCID